jgi:4-oxalocrotonate tautomerase
LTFAEINPASTLIWTRPRGGKINMPRLTVEAIEGKTIEQKRGLVRDITEAVVKNFNVAPETVSIAIYEMSRENYSKAGKLFIDS